MRDKCEKIIEEYSSKIKDVYIELHNYTFFHSPSEISQVDQRFIGRKKKSEKLKAILTNYETKSGAYLVTGYRGMGKTSFVNKVLNEISPSRPQSRFLFRLLRIALALFVLVALNLKLNLTPSLKILFVFCSYIALLYSGRVFQWREIKKMWSRGIIKFIFKFFRKFFIEPFIISEKFLPFKAHKNFFQDIVIIEIVYFSISPFKDINYISKWSFEKIDVILSLVLLLALINITYKLTYSVYHKYKKSRTFSRREIKWWLYIKNISFLFKEKIIFKINNAELNFININFGYEKLKEVDVLRLISRSIYTKYKNIRRPPIIIFSFELFLLFFCYLLVGYIYYQKPIIEKQAAFINNFSIQDYLPSQYENTPKTSPDSTINKPNTKIGVRLYISSVSTGLDKFFSSAYTDAYNKISTLIDRPTIQALRFILIDVNSGKELKFFFHLFTLSIGDWLPSGFKLIPRYLDYFFFFYFCLTLWIFKVATRYSLFGLVTNAYIKKRLKWLNDLIDSQVTTETENSTRGSSSFFKLNFLQRNKKNYPRADVREIEKFLIEILDEIEKIPRFMMRPKFVFVFDELDKIEAYQTKEDKGESAAESSLADEMLFPIEGTRKRQQKILALLSNLKYFLTTAKCKFIFIAGREMFDAALADVSDRNFFIGSIFHDVIYVDSFLSDDSNNKSNDLNSMTEHYICNFLFPTNEPKGAITLKNYNNYLQKHFTDIFKYETPHFVREDFKGENKCRDFCKKIHSKYFKDIKGFTKPEENFGGLINWLNDILKIPNLEELVENSLRVFPFISFIKQDSEREYEDLTNYEKHQTLMANRRFLEKVLPGDVWKKIFLKKQAEDFSDSEYLIYQPAQEKREKIIFLLQNFITYVTHRSNGAPKKITSLLEQYIVKPNDQKELDNALSISTNHENLHLKFTFYDQYKLGLITYLLNPIVTSINNSLTDYGDKILVSASFLTDHLLKFHKYAFSWRNLESTPEIIYTNKAPELRNFFQNMMQFLLQNHMQFVASGLFSFKFQKKISEEISFISRINELESAAFNFTLDESLAIKRYYSEKLHEVQRQYKDLYGSMLSTLQGRDKFINSIAALHMMLGDLYFYEEEYNDAIFEYKESIQFLRNLKPSEFSNSLFVLYIRNSLKLGLALEYRKTYDSAFEVYGELCEFIISYMSRMTKYEQNVHFWRDDAEITLGKRVILEDIRLIYLPFIARFQLIEKVSQCGITLSDIQSISGELEFLRNFSAYDEKYIVGTELRNKIGDILFFKNMPIDNKTNKDQKGIHFSFDCSHNLSLPRCPCQSCLQYRNGLHNLLAEGGGQDPSFDLIESLLNKLDDKTFPSNANFLKTMAITLSNIGDTLLSCLNSKEELTGYFLSKYFRFISDSYSDDSKYDQRNKVKYDKKLKIIKEFLGKEISPTMRNGSKIQDMLIYFYMAAVFFKKANEHKEFSFQFIKILYFFKDYLSIGEKKDKKEKKAVFKIFADATDGLGLQMIVSEAIKGLYRAYNSVHRVEIKKFQHIYTKGEKQIFTDQNFSLKSISLKADLQEINLVFEEIKLKCQDPKSIKQNHHIIKLFLATPYSVTYSIYNRMMQLRYKGEINKKILEVLKYKIFVDFVNGKSNNDDKKNDPRAQLKNILITNDEGIISFIKNCFGSIFEDRHISRIIEFLIVDSIYCFNEAIKLGKLYGVSFVLNYSLLASDHYNLAECIDYYVQYVRYVDDDVEGNNINKKQRIYEKLEKVLGADNLPVLSSMYHYEVSLQYNRSARETHSEGKAYKNLLQNVFFLNEDYNDRLYHFCVSAERYKISAGKIDEKINALREKVGCSRIYEHDNYIYPPPPIITGRRQ